jgi:chorismate mutase
MSQAAEQAEPVVSMVRYLRRTITEIDQAVVVWLEHRTELAQRLAALEATNHALGLDEIVANEDRAASASPGEEAEDAGAQLLEAYRQ